MSAKRKDKDGFRKKEEEINSIENAGASYNDGGITVIEFVKPAFDTIS